MAPAAVLALLFGAGIANGNPQPAAQLAGTGSSPSLVQPVNDQVTESPTADPDQQAAAERAEAEAKAAQEKKEQAAVKARAAAKAKAAAKKKAEAAAKRKAADAAARKKAEAARKKKAAAEARRREEEKREAEEREAEEHSPLVVHPGALCSGEGSLGVTSAGTPMRCQVASDGRLRWKRA